MITIKASCKKHPRYEAKRAPTADCKYCRQLYELKREYEATARTSYKETETVNGPISARSFCFGVVIPARLVGVPADVSRSEY